eukprot:445707-Prorocentrum_minimum.AAC.1
MLPLLLGFQEGSRDETPRLFARQGTRLPMPRWLFQVVCSTLISGIDIGQAAVCQAVWNTKGWAGAGGLGKAVLAGLVTRPGPVQSTFRGITSLRNPGYFRVDPPPR